MPIIKNSLVTVMVSDMDTAINFYTETLGLQLKNRYGDHWAEIEAPGITIGLHPKSKKDIKLGDNLSIGFGVDDIKQTVAALEKKGITFNMIDDRQIWLALFIDPDGNSLYFAQSKWQEKQP